MTCVLFYSSLSDTTNLNLISMTTVNILDIRNDVSVIGCPDCVAYVIIRAFKNILDSPHPTEKQINYQLDGKMCGCLEVHRPGVLLCPALHSISWPKKLTPGLSFQKLKPVIGHLHVKCLTE